MATRFRPAGVEGGGMIVLETKHGFVNAHLVTSLVIPVDDLLPGNVRGENELASVLRRQQEDDQRARGSPFDSDESKRDKIKILAF